MTKKDTIEALNDRIDALIMRGLETKRDKNVFKKLCRIHRQLVIEHLSKCITN